MTSPLRAVPMDVEVPDKETALKVVEGMTLDGRVNVSDEQILSNVTSAMRRGYPQVRTLELKRDRICLLGSGPSLNDTLPELLQLLREGAKLVTTNGAYHWAIERNLQPQVQVIMDGRESNARFVDPEIPRCKYLLASTCHPAVWDRVEGRKDVWVWHPSQRTDPAGQALERYYLGNWEPVSGGTTVVSRALVAMRMLGFVRFDLFGVDSCWLRGEHHAMPQPENAGDRQYQVRVAPSGHPELGRAFGCTGWHLCQLQDFLRILRMNAHQFLLNVHGDGLLAFALRVNADLADAEVTEKE